MIPFIWAIAGVVSDGLRYVIFIYILFVIIMFITGFIAWSVEKFQPRRNS